MPLRKVDGLRIDYLTGDADVRLPVEFIGQTPEFRLVAIGYWLLHLENERDKLAEAISECKRASLGIANMSCTLEGLLEHGHSVVYMSKVQPESGKRFLATFKCESCQKDLEVWESIGRLSFVKVTDVPQRNPTMKSLRRSAKRAYEAWAEVQSSLKNIGAARILENALITERTPHQMATTILKFAQSKKFTAAH